MRNGTGKRYARLMHRARQERWACARAARPCACAPVRPRARRSSCVPRALTAHALATGRIKSERSQWTVWSGDVVVARVAARVPCQATAPPPETAAKRRRPCDRGPVASAEAPEGAAAPTVAASTAAAEDALAAGRRKCGGGRVAGASSRRAPQLRAAIIAGVGAHACAWHALAHRARIERIVAPNGS